MQLNCWKTEMQMDTNVLIAYVHTLHTVQAKVDKEDTSDHGQLKI